MCSRYRAMLLLVVVALRAIQATSLLADDDKQATPPPLRVLLVGNSQLYYNDLPSILEKISGAAHPDFPRIKTGRCLTGGYTLEKHWNDGEGKDTARGKIADGPWDYVVLQEWGGTASPDKTVESLRQFQDLIEQHGAKAVLMSHAHFPAKYPNGFEDLYSQFRALAKDLKVPVAAGGRAWMLFLGETPTEQDLLDLYHPDKGHPGPKGSFLYACTLYGTITGKKPAGAASVVHGSHGAPTINISEPEAKRFVEAAWKACQERNESKQDASP